MRKAAVLGSPISHSLSPKLHQYWLKQYAIDGSYEAIETKPEALLATLNALQAAGYRGVNLTLPLKETVLAYLHDIEAEAKAIGAANTITMQDGKLIGANTDSYGFQMSIEPLVTRRKKAVMLGAGGAAKAVLAGLRKLGFQHIIVANRNVDKAQNLVRPGISAISWAKKDDALHEADLLVNATSLGMHHQDRLEIELTALPAHAAVCDIIYAPFETELLAEAKARGLLAIDGLNMLLQQAVPAFEAFYGQKPEVTADLKAHLQEALCA